MNRYSKGARSERELLDYLFKKDYSIMRSAGSGVNSLSPDVIAIKHGHGLAFECKAWEKNGLAIEHDKFHVLIDWERNTGMDTFIAWRMNHEGWFFIKLDEMTENEKNYTVTRRTAMSIKRTLESIVE